MQFILLHIACPYSILAFFHNLIYCLAILVPWIWGCLVCGASAFVRTLCSRFFPFTQDFRLELRPRKGTLRRRIIERREQKWAFDQIYRPLMQSADLVVEIIWHGLCLLIGSCYRKSSFVLFLQRYLITACVLSLVCGRKFRDTTVPISRIEHRLMNVGCADDF